ncbi:helix-turn-helix domain-containing protein [Pseudoruegeria sp. SK021]|uniref:helix-turn-helix domain-containing protein n=1 Tax=Pseudoruegeria sp. SK021 TaxID=1933035 RepID=UPI000A231493|nr:helix-turn-helix domain-containing protein [Pseudoruegeria sp. SK021]OSP52757.1 hypothetical protein BV911_18620 [Pseudoruegeria sp. SK021]
MRGRFWGGGVRGRASVSIELGDEERGSLEAQLRKHRAARSLSDRCRIVLRCAGGLTSKKIATELGHSEHTVGKWRRRFAEHRLEGLSDEYRAGRPRTVSDEQVADVIKRTLETTPKGFCRRPILCTLPLGKFRSKRWRARRCA